MSYSKIISQLAHLPTFNSVANKEPCKRLGTVWGECDSEFVFKQHMPLLALESAKWQQYVAYNQWQRCLNTYKYILSHNEQHVMLFLFLIPKYFGNVPKIIPKTTSWANLTSMMNSLVSIDSLFTTCSIESKSQFQTTSFNFVVALISQFKLHNFRETLDLLLCLNLHKT